MNEFLSNLMYIVFTMVVPILVGTAVKFVKAWISTSEADLEETEAQKKAAEKQITSNLLQRAVDLIETAVVSTNQTFVDALKKAGTFDKDAAAEAFNKSKSNILSLLSSEIKSAIRDSYGDIERWVDLSIEATVKKQKNKEPSEIGTLIEVPEGTLLETMADMGGANNE